MTGDLAATTTDISFLDSSEVPESRNKSAAEQDKGENKWLIEHKIRFHGPDVAALETTANLSPSTPDFQHRGYGLVKDGDSQQKIHY